MMVRHGLSFRRCGKIHKPDSIKVAMLFKRIAPRRVRRRIASESAHFLMHTIALRISVEFSISHFRLNLLRPEGRRTGKWSAGAETQERSRSETTVAVPQAEARRTFDAVRMPLVMAIISGKISGNDKIFCAFDCQQNCQQRSNRGVVPE
jgi:hypothetical protein